MTQLILESASTSAIETLAILLKHDFNLPKWKAVLPADLKVSIKE